MNNLKRKPFEEEVVDEMGDGPDDDYSVEMEDEEEGGDETAHEDQIMAVKQFGKAAGIQIADPERALEALKTLIDSMG